MRHDHLADCRRWWRERQEIWVTHFDLLADIRAAGLDILHEPWRTNSAIAALHYSLIADYIRAQELPRSLQHDDTHERSQGRSRTKRRQGFTQGIALGSRPHDSDATQLRSA